MGQHGQAARRQAGLMQLHFQYGNEGAQIRIAAALANAAHGALNHHGPGLHRGQGAGHGQPAVVVAVDADGQPGPGQHLADDLLHLIGQGAAVGVAQRQAGGAALPRCLEGSQGVGRIGLVAVEKMLRVKPHPQSAVCEGGNAVANDAQVFLRRAAKHIPHMEQRAFAEQADCVRTAAAQGLQPGIVLCDGAGANGGPKGSQAGMTEQPLFPHHGKESGVLGIGSRIAALDAGNPQLVQGQGNAALVLQGKGHALGLRAVPQCGVQQLDHAHASALILPLIIACPAPSGKEGRAADSTKKAAEVGINQKGPWRWRSMGLRESPYNMIIGIRCEGVQRATAKPSARLRRGEIFLKHAK